MGKRRPILALLVVSVVLAVVVIVPATASAAGPSATTGSATNVTSSSAVLNGTGSPGGSGSFYFFNYGTTPAYGSVTPHTAISASGPAMASITGLLPGTRYHYQLVVVDPTGPSAAGADVGFTTPTVAVATTGQASSVTTSTAELNGVANTADPNSSWFFQYGPTNTYGHTTARQPIQPGVTLVATEIKGLTPHTSYHFRLVVTQNSAPSDGSDASFTTAKAYGHAALRGRRLQVKHGFAVIPFTCTGFRGAPCRAHVSLQTRVKAGKHLVNLGCGRGGLATTAGRRKTIHLKLGSRCGNLLRTARHNRLSAKLRAAFSTHQPTIQAGVTLLG